ncbi:DUF4245 domain-containing protein [Flexivirga alba]|uniref:DUF4245 domain-containing protein n=1 Tax=Flexivirga alba TaxID=702742 RepID=A0ABW2AF70_9MICO
MSESESPAGGPSARPQAPAVGRPTVEQPAPRRRGLGSARSMVISMVLVVLAVLVWWAWVPRASNTAQPTADVAGIAREIGLSKHWDPAVAVGLPKGWQAVNVRLVSVDQQPDTWQAGYDAPGGSYARVVQTDNGATSWVQAQTGQSKPAGSVTVDGVRWSKLQRTDGGERSLVRSQDLGGLSTVVTGTGGWDQLQAFAKSLKPLSKSQLAKAGPTAPATS